MFKDTIFALSTVVGKSGVAVVRISGERALKVLDDLGVKLKILPNEFKLAKLYNPVSSEILDQAIILYFQAPHSFTGEDIVELHLHGSVAVVKDVIAALNSLNYLKLAEPGEFSKRAFFNGKMDLTQAEGLVQLIEAETTVQRQVAFRQFSGELETLYDNWRNSLISLLAKVEALIDFPEDDIPQSIVSEVEAGVHNLKTEIENHLATAASGEVIARGIKVAIIGAPNVGKSSLLNLLAKRDVAIVADIAGTTRDVIEVKIDLKGFPVILHDTAGLRETTDTIELEGVRRAQKASEESDINIYIIDASTRDREQLLPQVFDKPHLILLNKTDLLTSPYPSPENYFRVSVKKGLGIDNFLQALLQLVEETYTPAADPIITQERYRKLLNECLHYINNFKIASQLEVSAEYLRLAASCIGAITGKIEVDEILDEIFSSFCIGK
jgi:tRNA modification GTPase